MFHKVRIFCKLKELHFKIWLKILFFHRICLRIRTVLYFDQTFESKFSKTTRPKFKVNIFSDRMNLALSEYFSNFNICRVVFKNFDLKNSLWYEFGQSLIKIYNLPNHVDY